MSELSEMIFSDHIYIYNQNTRQELFGNLIRTCFPLSKSDELLAGAPLTLTTGYELVIKHQEDIGQIISEFISVNEYELIRIAQNVNDDVQGCFLDLISNTQLSKLIFIGNDYLECCDTTKEELLYWANSIASFRAFIDLCNDNRAVFTEKWIDGFESVMCINDSRMTETDAAVFIEDNLSDGHKKWTEEILCTPDYSWDKNHVDYNSFNPDENAKRIPDLLSATVEEPIPIYSGNTLVVETYQHPIAVFYSSIRSLIEEDVLPKRCKNCGKYFVPAKRSDTTYCNRASPQDDTKTCKEFGARDAWARTLRESEAAGLYRKIYMSKQMLARFFFGGVPHSLTASSACTFRSSVRCV